ncbi:MAG: SGNH/GDSL hydrolase family protein [Candidatus Cyclobacteriaceae bacterium M2_1C_046]
MAFQGWLLKRRIPTSNVPDDISGTSGAGERYIKLVTLGESTIAGAGVKNHKTGFTGTLADSLAEKYRATVDWEVVAKSGYSASKVCNRLIGDIQQNDPDLIVIGLGANDAFEFTSPTKWKKDIGRIINKLKGKYPEAQIYFLNMPPVGSFPELPFLLNFFSGKIVKILGKELAEIARQYRNVYYFDEPINLSEWKKKVSPKATVSDLFSDGIHPSGDAYQIWAKEAAKRISL